MADKESPKSSLFIHGFAQEPNEHPCSDNACSRSISSSRMCGGCAVGGHIR